MSQVYGNQTLDFQNTMGDGLWPLKIDYQEAGTYRQFRLKNISDSMVENAKLRLVEIGENITDVSQLMQRSNLLMSYIRMSSGGKEQQYLGVGPISVMTEDPEELESVLMNGWAQLSADIFRWASLLELGPIQKGEYVNFYVRYLKATSGEKAIFQFSLRNIGSDTLLKTVLTASGTDLISLDGQTFTKDVQIGDLKPAAVMIIWLQTDNIGTRIINGLMEAIAGTDVVSTQLFWVDRGKSYTEPLTVFSISIGGMATAAEEEEILAEIQAIIARNKKNMAGAHWSGTETGQLDLLEE